MKESELIYNILCRDIPIGVFQMTMESVPRLISANPIAVQTYGYDDFEEIRNIPFSNLFADKSDLDSLSITVQVTGRIRDYACHHKKKDGSLFLAWISANLVTGEADISYCEGIILDVQERKRLTNAFEGRTKELEVIFDTLSELTFVTDLEGRIVRCNRAAIIRLGMSSQQIIGQPINYLFFGEKLSEIDPFAAGVREAHIPKISGDFLIANNPFSSAAIIQGMVHVMMDITERKKAEEMVRERESIYRILAERSYAGVYVVQDGRFRFINSNAASYAGYTREELLDRETGILVHPEDSEEESKNAGDMLKGKRVTPYEFRIIAKDGETRWIMETVTSIKYEGRPAILGNSMDITERRQREMHDLHTQKLESVGQLAAGIAHEINTPIQFIGDNIHFMNDAFRDIFSLASFYDDLKNVDVASNEDYGALRDRIMERMDEIDLGYLQEEIPRAIEQSLDGIQRVSGIVKAMREFSHPGGAEKTYLDLNKAIESTIILTRNEWKYAAEMITSFTPDLPLVKGYPADLNQAILNLLVNAAQAVQAKLGAEPGEKGRIEVTTRRDGDEAEICIRDTGTGIPSEIQSKIFDPFFTTKEVGKGTGQGLAIAHNIIVRKHGGRIYCESKVGGGTAFYIHLPLEEAAPMLDTAV
ncbi:MAG: PAS domain S-box protein [Syntrophales bacterium]